MLTEPLKNGLIACDDVNLHYVEWGQEGTPIVFLHGLTANAMCFQSFADVLAPSYRVIAYDLRGRGDSDKPSTGYSVPQHARDLLALLDALQLDRPIIVGHSLGALIALYFAAHYPEKLSKLVLIDAGAKLPWKDASEMPLWLTAAISRLGISIPSYQEYLDRLKQAPYLGPYWNPYIDLYFEHDIRIEPNGSVRSKAFAQGIREESQNYPQAEPEAQWANVQAPTLLLRAGQGLTSESDQLLSEADAHQIRDSIANCQYINYPTLNHYIIIFGVDPAPAEAIQRFIEQGKAS
ncbi:alpha/beta fold hydrolase [Ktedonospora formicarum]|uniref:Alpha/beta hydrolase n=1 Tax=Ktedonospora formicarum TaxID=2778364 RepID=A0A8J3I7T8_9CHLR|nr:alpha/beta hydrolase [Ktedonospora formicarum]GHO48435.1 alpha/beta hydrolase [Ktedonospora formicarum]